MSKRNLQDFLAMPLAGPDAEVLGGLRMPPSIVVGHGYLVSAPPEGQTWFEDCFPHTREEAYVENRVRSFIETLEATRSVYVLLSGGELLKVPSHIDGRECWLLFSSKANATQFSVGFSGIELGQWDAETFAHALREMCDVDAVIGADWTSDLVGAELEPRSIVPLIA